MSSIRLLVPMRTRDPHEKGRVSSPLELLFDLTFVVAISVAGVQLAHRIEADHLADGVPSYLAIFFAIWWAWLNFSWQASGFDTDDVPYRLLTMLQMAGVLVLAAGIPAAFEGDFDLIVLGYLIMRIGNVAQWLRIAIQDPEQRAYARFMAVGISVVQLGWVLRHWVPVDLGAASFVLLMLAEFAVPLLASRIRPAAYHPHHISERYGLFTIIVLGEAVVSASIAFQSAFEATDAGVGMITIGVATLVILFGIWWLYFLVPAGDGLADRTSAYLWGYGHGVIFASIAATAAAIDAAIAVTAESAAAGEVTATASMGPENLSAPGPVLLAYCVAVPVILVLASIRVIHAPLDRGARISFAPAVGAVVLLAVLPLAATGVGLPTVIVLLALVVAGLVAVTIALKVRAAARV